MIFDEIIERVYDLLFNSRVSDKMYFFESHMKMGKRSFIKCKAQFDHNLTPIYGIFVL